MTTNRAASIRARLKQHTDTSGRSAACWTRLPARPQSFASRSKSSMSPGTTPLASIRLKLSYTSLFEPALRNVWPVESNPLSRRYGPPARFIDV
jgi:hypothetical protein